MVAVGTLITERPPHRSRRALLTHRAPPSGRTSAARSLKPHAHQRTAANRIDVVARLSVRTTAACRLFPSGEALPSTTSAGSCLPLFDRFLGYYDLIRLLIRVHARRTASAFPSRPGTSPGTGETSQVPRKELLHVHKVSDCARFSHASQYAMEDVAFSSAVRDRHLGIRPVSQLNTWPMVSPVNASRLPSRAEPRASLGVGAVG